MGAAGTMAAMCTGPNIEAGKRHRAAETRAWWARWDRELGRQYMSAIAQRQVRKVRRILVAERARQGGCEWRIAISNLPPQFSTSTRVRVVGLIWQLSQ